MRKKVNKTEECATHIKQDPKESSYTDIKLFEHVLQQIGLNDFDDEYSDLKDNIYMQLPVLNHFHLEDSGLSLTDYVIYLTILSENLQNRDFTFENLFWRKFFNISSSQIEKSLRNLLKKEAISYVDNEGKHTGKTKPRCKRKLHAFDIGHAAHTYTNEDFIIKEGDIWEMKKEDRQDEKERRMIIKAAIKQLNYKSILKSDIERFADPEYKKNNIKKYDSINNSISLFNIKIEDLIKYLKKKK